MLTGIVRWEFIHGYGQWSWRAVRAYSKISGSASAFVSLDVAKAHATVIGFDPFSQYWTATNDGHTTHYRPGKTPVNLPCGETPQN